MEKRIKQYVIYIAEQLDRNLTAEEKEILMKDLLIQIGFFQHERLVHLIVTVVFAILTFMVFLGNLFLMNPLIYVLTGALLILLVPYIRHYYVLENNVQKLYDYYEQVRL
ncbi:MAG: hypothetical protein LBR68_07295 [Lachnoclostridium sp.]|nr:hypothetical protein [Lachnoclostridium sp.]